MYPSLLNVVTGSGLGVSHSSLNLIGKVNPTYQHTLGIEMYANAATGNFIVKDKAITHPTTKDVFDLKMIFNSLVDNSADAWRFNIPRFTKLPINHGIDHADQDAIFTEDDGHEVIYHNENGTWLEPIFGNGRTSLSWDQDHWVRTLSDGSKELYDEQGLLKEKFSKDMQGLRFEYTDGILTKLAFYNGDEYRIVRNDLTWKIVYTRDSESEILHTYTFNQPGVLSSSFSNLGAGTNYKYAPDPNKINTHLMHDINSTDNEKIVVNLQSKDKVWEFDRLQVSSESTTILEKNGNSAQIKSMGSVQEITWNNDNQIESSRESLELDIRKNVWRETKFAYKNNQLTQKTYPDKSTEQFEYNHELSHLTTIKHRNESLTHYEYEGNPRNIINAISRQENINSPKITKTLCYSRPDQTDYFLSYVISPMGRTTEYTPNNQNLIAEERHFLKNFYPLGKLPTNAKALKDWVSKLNPQSKTYKRTNYNNLRQVFEVSEYGHLDQEADGIADNNLSYMQMSFDHQNNLLKQKNLQQLSDPDYTYLESDFSFDAYNRNLSKTIGQTQKTNNEYDDANRTTTHKATGGDTTVEKKLGNNAVVSSVSSGNTKSGIEFHETNNSLREDGFIQYSLDPENKVNFFLRDSIGNIVFQFASNGVVTGTYNNVEKRYKETVHYATPIDLASSTVDIPGDELDINDVKEMLRDAGPNPEDRHHYEFFDSAGRVKYDVDAENYVTEFSYDMNDHITQKIQYKIALTAAQIDQLKNGESLALSFNPNQDRCTQHFFDLDGLLIAEKNPAGYITTYQNDAAGRMIQSIKAFDPQVHTGSYTLPVINNNEKNVETYCFYDAANNKEFEIDAEGYLTQYLYLPGGLIYQTIRYDNKVDKNWYSNTENPPAIPAPTVADNTITYQYDSLNRLMNKTDSSGKVINQTYDLMNNIVSTHSYEDNLNKLSGDTIRSHYLCYDEFGRVEAEVNTFAAHTIKQIENSDRTDKDKRIAIEEIWRTQSKRYTYNKVGKKIQEIDSLGNTTLFFYDDLYRLRYTINPVGAIQENKYNNFNEIEETIKYAITLNTEALKNLTGGFVNEALASSIKSDPKDISEKFKFTKRSQLESHTDGELYKNKYEYNAFGEIYKEHLAVNSKEPSLHITHEYDTRGNPISKTVESGNLTTKEQFEYNNPHGLCTAIINEENEKSSIEYDKLGRESKSTNPLLDFTETEHDSLGRVKSHTDEMGNTTKHEYNTALRTHTITTAENEKNVITENIFGEAVSIVDANQSNLTMSHAPDGQVEETKQSDITISKKTFNTEGLCTDAVDGNGIRTEMKYNAAHQLNEIIHDAEDKKLSTTMKLNAFGSAEEIANANGVITTQEFDKRNLPTLKTHDTEGLKATTQLNHDGLGNLLETTKGKADQPDSYKEKNNYDAIGRNIGNIVDPINALRPGALNIDTQKINDKTGRTVIAVDANKNKTFLFYDANGNKRFSVDPMGNVSEWKHDKAGKVISEKIYFNRIKLEGISEKKSIQDIIALTNPNPNDTERLTYYDKNGRERFIIDKLLNDDNSYTGKVTEYTYNNSTKKAKVTTHSKFIDYSNMDNKKTDEIALEVQRNAAPELDRSIRYIYDSLNRERFIVDGEGCVTEKIYDNNNNVISHIQYSNALNSVDKVEKFNDVDFKKLITANTEQDRTVHYIYNALNKPIFTIDAEGGVTRLDYTKTLKVEQESKFADKIDTTNLSYAEIKNKVSSLVIDRTKDRVTSIEYDAADRIKKITDELNNFETYEYDALGNEISRTDKNNNVWKREYDRANRAYEKINPSRTVTSVEYKDGKLVPTDSQMEIKSKYEVNKLGNIESISLAYNTDKARTLINKFDLINNPTGADFGVIAIDDPNAVSSLMIRPEINTAINTTKVYNSNNKLVAEQIENGAWKFYVRDTLGNIAYELEPIENTSALTTSYLCIHRNYSAFNEVEFETTYSTPITFSTDLYKESGITLDTIKNWIVAATEDRHIATVRDRKGKIKKIELDEINYAEINEKNNPDIKQGIPTQEFEYNAFGEKIRSSQKISESKWADYYFWYNKNGMSVAECNPVKAVSISEYDAFNKVTLHTEYADYLSKNPSQDLTFKQLSDLVDNNNKKNRQTKTEYDLRGQKKSETQLHVTRQRLVGVGENRSIEDYETNLKKLYTYTKLGKEESVTYEDGISKTYKYYDSNGNTIAEVGICFDSLDDNMQLIKLRPLTYYGYDEHGKKVKTQRFYLGVTDEIINPAVLPKATPHADDQVELEFHNKLGLAIYKQDAVGNLRALSYTATKQIARKWHKLTSFAADGQFNQINIDEDRTTYNLQGKDTSKEIRRNNVTEDIIIKKLNSFGEQTAEDHGTNEWPIFNKYSKNGDLWSTNSEQGVSTVILKDLAGHEILKVISGASESAQDLKNITEEQVPTLITDQAGFKELEFTLSKRDNLGRMLNKITPPLIQKKISQNIPVQMSVIEKTEGETKKVYLSWLKQTDATFVSDSIKLTVKGSNEARVFPIVNTPDTNYFTIDISDLQTDIYNFEMDYYYITDNVNKTTVSKSMGTIQCVTSLTNASHNVVCTITDNDNLILNGNLTDVEAVELFQEGRFVARIPLQAPPHQNTLSLSNRRSGHYTVKPVLRNETYLAESPLLSVISPIASAEPMSKEINCSAEATLVDQTIKLNIVVPDEYKKRSAKLHINFKSSLGKLTTAVWTLDTLVNPDHILEIPPYFHEFLSLDLKLDMGNNKFIQLYKNEQPSDINVTPKDDWEHVGKEADNTQDIKDKHEYVDVAEDGESKEEPKSSVTVPKVKNDKADADQVNFKFKSRTFALITPNALPRDAKQISILDVSKDRYAQWTTLPITNADAGGFTVDVTNLAAGNYPFKASDAEHAHILTVSKGNQVYSSDSSSTSEDTQQAVNRAFTWDAWNNTSSITDSLGHTTEFEHNDLNKETKKVEPEVDCVQDNNTIVRQKLTTLTGYNDQGYEFATSDPKGQVQSDTLNQIGGSLTKMLGDGTISKKISYDIFSRIKNYSDAENNIWKRVHDRVGNILSQTSPMQKTTNYLYNEKKQTAQETNPLHESTRYQHDARNNISERTNADGSFVRMTHDHNHRETTNTCKEGTQSWARDAFGHAKNYTNLSGIITEYIYNQAKKLTRQRNNDVNRRKWAKLMFDHYDMHGQSIDAAYLKFMAVMGQDIEYKYTQSHLLEMRDRSGLQLMRFKLNTEGNRVQTEIRRLDPNNVEGEGELVRIMAATLDALGRETKVIDSNVMLDIAMDAAGNRRFTNASIMNADHSVTVENTTNTFDKANRHASQSTAGANISKSYKNNLLNTINTNGIVDTLTHNADH
ncbi:MAG: hypothetical protein P4M12_07455, partial [Gammaproteobacteria bacterium]|nr:hypothetical protein [Gammaproteobacteria bacterium]